MNIHQLGRFIAQQKIKGSDMISRFEVERHNRFAYPVSTFILTIIGVSLSSRKVRGGTGLHIGIGIVLAFSFILFSKFAEEFAKGGLLPPYVSVWIRISSTRSSLTIFTRKPRSSRFGEPRRGPNRSVGGSFGPFPAERRQRSPVRAS